MNHYLYLPAWYLKNVVGKQHKPLQTVLFLTDYCNLNCLHCTQAGHAGTIMKPWRQIESELRASYAQGSRFLDLEGGEPTLWRDGSLGINDVIRLAKEIGFFSVTVTTNGQKPFGYLKADSIWVSVDGYRKVHDLIRGEGAFEKLDRNISESGLAAVSINMAVNSQNWKSVRDVVRYAEHHPGIRSVSVNFHTPYPGTEDLMPGREIKNRVIDLLIAMKKKGYPIMNSISGMNLMRGKGSFAYCWITDFVLTDGTRLDTCPGKQMGVCENCGFSMSGEMRSVVRLKPDTLLAGMKLRM